MPLRFKRGADGVVQKEELITPKAGEEESNKKVEVGEDTEAVELEAASPKETSTSLTATSDASPLRMDDPTPLTSQSSQPLLNGPGANPIIEESMSPSNSTAPMSVEPEAEPISNLPPLPQRNQLPPTLSSARRDGVPLPVPGSGRKERRGSRFSLRKLSGSVRGKLSFSGQLPGDKNDAVDSLADNVAQALEMESLPPPEVIIPLNMQGAEAVFATVMKQHWYNKEIPWNTGNGFIVGKGVQLKGVVEDAELVVVEGDLEGEVHCRYLVISQEGSFTGLAETDHAEIAGRVDGRGITSKKALHLHSSGRISADVTYSLLTVDNGGVRSSDSFHLRNLNTVIAFGRFRLPSSFLPSSFARY
ncbi:unnamed protein product [Chrysoparadoxa australica]